MSKYIQFCDCLIRSHRIFEVGISKENPCDIYMVLFDGPDMKESFEDGEELSQRFEELKELLNAI